MLSQQNTFTIDEYYIHEKQKLLKAMVTPNIDDELKQTPNEQKNKTDIDFERGFKLNFPQSQQPLKQVEILTKRA